MDLARWINFIYAVLSWGAVFLLIKPHRIKDLLPAGILAAIVLFAGELYLVSLGLIRFNQAVSFVAGIPTFNLLWGVAGGILMMNYMKEDFAKKLPIVFLFTIILEAMVYFALQVGHISFLGPYTSLHDTIINFVVLLLFAQVAEGLVKKRIYRF